MATNLTPELLKLLQANAGQPGYLDPSGRAFHPVYNTGFSGGGGAEGGDMQSTLTGYQGYDFLGKDAEFDDYTGKQRDSYNAQGEYTGSDQFQERENMAKTFAKYAAILGAAGLAGGAMAGGAAGGSGAAGGATGNGAFLGEAAWTPTAGGGAMPGGFGAATATMGGAGGAGGAAAGAGGSLSSGLSSLLPSGAGSLLGPAATVIGGLLGAKGQQSSQTSTRDIPEWLKPYVQKNLGYAGSLLDKQMAPGYLQGYDDMRSVGQNLLNQPIAGNGFNRFFPGK